MNRRNEKPLLVHPLLSDRPTGMGVAAEAIRRILVPALADGASGVDRLFRWINDRCPIGMVRMILRIAAVQIVPIAFPRRRLVFTSHHAPLWRTGRHAVVLHDLIALHHPDQAPIQAVYFRRILPHVIRSARRLIVISASVQSAVNETFPHRTGDVFVVPSSSHRLERSASGSRRIAARREERLLLVLGANYAHKNLGLVLEALAGWPKDRLDVRPTLHVTACRRHLWRGLDRLEGSGAVVVRDYVADADIDELLSRASALLFVSRDEGLGLPPLEAMAVGCPVVCSDIPVLRETCGEAAAFVDPNSAADLRSLLVSYMAGELDEAFANRQRLGVARVASFRAQAIRVRWKEFFESWA